MTPKPLKRRNDMTIGKNDKAGEKKQPSREPLFLVGFDPDERKEEIRRHLIAALRKSGFRITVNTKSDQQN